MFETPYNAEDTVTPDVDESQREEVAYTDTVDELEAKDRDPYIHDGTGNSMDDLDVLDGSIDFTANEYSDNFDVQEPSDKVADLVEYIVLGLVDDQDAVTLDLTDAEDGSLIEIGCAASDAGRIIGRKGRTIKAIRVLAHALAQRVGIHVEVEVVG